MNIRAHTRWSSFLFLSGLCTATLIAVGLDTSWAYRIQDGQRLVELRTEYDLVPVPPRALSEVDLLAAERAWNYFKLNTRSETGLVDSVAGFPSTTLWDQGSYLLGMVAAERLGILPEAEFDQRVVSFVETFMRLPLFDGKLPNKVYNTQTLAMVDYENTIVEHGIGWSALDVARMLMAFRSLERLHPEHGDLVRDLLQRWDLEAMAIDGELIGATIKEGEPVLWQEGRLGYEQYGARAAALWGLDVLQAVSSRRAIRWSEVSGVKVPTDVRAAETFQAITPIASEPFILQELELGLDSEGRILAERVYRAQEERYMETGILTAVSEDHVDQPPHFLYSSVFSNGTPWAVVSEQGEMFPLLRSQSVKASFGWYAIYDTEYTRQLRDALTDDIGNPDLGWPAGIYEADGTVNEVYSLNTNAIVLQSIHYIAFGPLWQRREVQYPANPVGE